MTQMAKVSVPGQFPPGTKVQLFDRVSDFFDPSRGKALKTAKANKHAEAAFSNVKPGPYWVVGEVGGLQRTIRVTATAPAPAKKKARPARNVSEPTPKPRVVKGARSTVSGRARRR